MEGDEELAAQALQEQLSGSSKTALKQEKIITNNLSPAVSPAAALASLSQQHLVYLGPSPKEKTSTIVPPIAPQPQEEIQPLTYVNPKQYNRIMRRRETRTKMEELCRNQEDRKHYLHESRHKHACRRKRGPGGRFLTKAELEAMAQDDDDHHQSLAPDNKKHDHRTSDTPDEQLAANAMIAVHQQAALGRALAS